MTISNVRKFAKNPFMVCMMIVAILSSSFLSLHARTNPIKPSFSQEEFFNAIYFLQGDLVNEIPVLSKMKQTINSKTSSRDVQKQAEIIQGVNQIDPTFLSKLYRDIMGNDHHTISATIQEGSDLVILAAAKYTNDSNLPDISDFDLGDSRQKQLAMQKIKNSLNNSGSTYGNPQNLVALALAVFFYLAVFVLVVVPFAELDGVDVKMLSKLSEDGSISHEKLVNQLVEL